MHNDPLSRTLDGFTKKMPTLNFTVDLAALESSNQQKQRHRMMLALVLLLIALIAVVVRSRDTWFQGFSKPPSEVLEDTRVTSAKAQENKFLSFHRLTRRDQGHETRSLSTLPTIMKSDLKKE